MFFHNPIDKPKPLPRPLKSNHTIKISTEVFLFWSFDQVLLLANTNILLPDIGGEVMGIKTTHNALICRGAASVITNPSHGVYIGVSMTSRRLDGHGMVEENRSETALPGARAIVPEMTAECREANSSGTWALSNDQTLTSGIRAHLVKAKPIVDQKKKIYSKFSEDSRCNQE
ncbi:hypothetical protein F2Q69_00003853 [Brassica cretica]|uniref:Uncharacterized protein n=1 Tax=Brassica cretica TaxID=69181 RepID=A0A8S9PD50_BRACR|nr:hypothetical protein F2Q69_00003853 [Brassica cretica]